ncbi:MAG: tripartite tricarboxylate transporter permease, partial [Candidatus Rokubacteria bacterium]|nr:tripartite tricarboxylate transporter permease [Candidatus Rokubacteria bacterium]
LFVGAIPGLTATMAAALLVPFTFFMDPLPSLVAIVTMSAMAIFAGDIPAALVRIPGTPSSAAYTDDSYELTKQGKAELVLGVDVVTSAIGGLMGAVVLMIAAPLLAEVALRFTSFEYFWLAALGLSATVMIASTVPLKAGLALLLGLFFSTIGVDITLGYPRFTFGTTELLNGLDFIPAMIGLFGVSEVLRNMGSATLSFPIAPVRAERIFRGLAETLWRYKANMVRAGAIGTFIGILPGAGADIAAWIAYAVARRFSREPEKFGKGAIEPIVDAGTANNACLAGDWVPALVFGIPGDSITAIVIGVLFMKGLRPGPMIFEQQPQLVYAVYLSFIVANLLLIPFGYLAIKASGFMLRVPRNVLMPAILMFCVVGAFAFMLRVPRNVLMPAILMFCVVGAFAINNSLVDVGLMLAMGVFGYFLEANGIPVAPIVLGMVLGPILEQNFMVSMIKTEWDLTQFVRRPVALVLGGLTVLVWLTPLYPWLLARGRRLGPRPPSNSR